MIAEVVRHYRFPLAARLYGRLIVTPDDCWLWTGGRTIAGYGVITIGQRQHYVHRLVYTRMVGPVPAGHDLDHRCRVRHCANPLHMEPVTNSENCKRGARSRYASLYALWRRWGIVR